MDEASRFLYPDARPFLSCCAGNKMKLYLVSIGGAFQRRKILKSGLVDFFDAARVCSVPRKGPAVARLKARGGHPILFIDDIKEMIEDVKETCPSVVAIQVARQRQKESASADYVVKNLMRLIPILAHEA